MKLIIEDDEGRRTVIPFVGSALTIGRLEGNHVLLGEKNVSRKHGRIFRGDDGRFFIEDLGSFTGIRVNGERVKKKRIVKAGDHIQISEYDLSLQPSPDELKEQEKSLGDDDDEPTALHAAPAGGDDLTSTLPSVAPVEDGTFDTPTAPQLRAAPAAAAEAYADADTLPPAEVVPDEAKTAENKAAAKAEAPAPSGETRALTPSRNARLVGLSGTFRGKEWPLSGSSAAVGRALENEVVIDHPSVSRVHARLALADGAWKFLDTESKNGLLVNGKPCAGVVLAGGETVELGHLKFAFVAAGQPYTLPIDVTPQRGLHFQPGAAPERGGNKSFLWLAGLAVLALVLGGAAVVRRESKKAARLAVVTKNMQAAAAAVEEHRYVDALAPIASARASGATDDELKPFDRVQTEARAEQQYRELEKAMGAGDLDNARAVAQQLAGKPTWYASRATEKGEAIKGSYIKAHLARAAAARGADAALCTAQVNLVLLADALNAEAAALAPACATPPPPPSPDGAAAGAPAGGAVAAGATAPGAAAAVAPPSTEVAAAAVAAPPDAEARRLLNQGNQKLIGADFPSAIADFEKVVALKPEASVLGPAYHSLGVAYMRQGNTEEGARYYRLYLPLCTVPAECEALRKTLAQYDATHSR